MRSALFAALAGLCLGTGTLAQGAAPAPTPDPGASAATWQMPWQIAPLAVAPPTAETVFTAFVPGTGLVRGTQAALAGIGTPLQPAPGPNRTVDACRDVVQAEAMRIGARQVEAASAGREHRARGGRVWAPVRMRITYAGPSGYEVREATMICVTDLRGKILDAYV